MSEPPSAPREEPVSDDRRAAVTGLGDAIRSLASAAIETRAEPSELLRIAADAEALAAALRRGAPAEGSEPVADEARSERWFNPVVGAGNGIAPPVAVEIRDGAAVGRCTLDQRYEGPPTYAHGGVSAMLLDQIMGHAVAASGHPGVTGRLQVRYRSAVPLHQPLVVEARVIDVLGVRAAVNGTIALASAPDDQLVEAEGRFVALRPEQIERLFGPSGEVRR